MARTKFRYQAPYSTIYRVGKVIGGEQQCQFTSIQAAINKAVADGHTSNDNPAFIEIYSGTYTENLSLSPGVHLIGQGTKIINPPAANGVGSEVTVVGNMTYANSNGLTRSQNRINIRGICFTVLNGITFTISGTGAVDFLLDNCVVQKQTTGDVNPAFQFANTNAASRIRWNDTFIFHDVATSIAMDLQRGSTEFRGKLAGVVSLNGVTLGAAATLSNTASLSVANNASFTSGPFTAVVNLTNASNVVNGDRATFQNTLVGGIMFNCTANANVRMRQCGLFLQDATSVMVKAVGGAAPTFISVSNAWGGTLSAPFNACDAAVSQFENTGTASNRLTRSVYVGGGRGYGTIQAAINAAAAMNVAAGGGRTRVFITPGLYIENLTLADNVDLIADDQAASNNGIGLPVNISGHHSWTPGSANALVQIRGIGFNVQTDQGVNPFFLFAAGAQTRPQLLFLECNIFYNFANVRNLFTVTGTVSSVLSITRTSIAHSTDQTGQTVFDYSGASGTVGAHQLFVTGQLSGVEENCGFGGSTVINADTLMLKTGAGLSSFFKFLNLSSLGDRFWSIDHTDAVINIAQCYISSFCQTAAGVWAKFNVAGAINLDNCRLLQSGNLIAQDSGTQASGDFTFTANPAPGDTVTINGVVVTFNTDVTIGATKEDTAQNLFNFINSTGIAGIANNVYSTYVAASAVTGIVARDTGVAGNAITLASSVPATVVPSGATLSGGVNGTGGTFQYGACSFTTTKRIQSSLTVIQNADTLTSV